MLPVVPDKASSGRVALALFACTDRFMRPETFSRVPGVCKVRTKLWKFQVLKLPMRGSLVEVAPLAPAIHAIFALRPRALCLCSW
jgi:hypothetical protein